MYGHITFYFVTSKQLVLQQKAEIEEFANETSYFVIIFD